jgi:signal transduction histidine kinase
MRQRPWLALIVGFGGLLALMAAAEAGALFFLNSLQHSSADLQAHFLSRNRTLEKIRSNIYLSGTFARDSLLAPEVSGARAQIATLVGLRRDTDAALDSYAQSLEAGEAKPFQTLRSEIDAYWNILDQTFSWTPEERNKNRYAFFYEELVPRRTSMLQIADRVGALNEEALKRGDGTLGALFGRLQLGLVAMICITLLGGTTLSALTIVHILRLEGEARRRLEESVHAKAGLQDLSAKLVRAQENERRALSRELHDEVGQSFSAVLMEAENLLDLGPADEARPHIEAIRGVAQKGMNEIRDMALLLRPSMLDDFGLAPALDWHARETAKRTGLNVEVTSDIPDELPEEHTTCIYRVVQEALNNCARHAQARTVQVSVRREERRILLSVRDDGSGFDPRRVRGMGMLGMEERVRHLGGSLEIDSTPGYGTLLQVFLPLASLNGEGPNGAHSHSSG